MDEHTRTTTMDYYARHAYPAHTSPHDANPAEAETETAIATAAAAETETETATAIHSMNDPRPAIAAASPGPETVRHGNPAAMCETDHRAMDWCV